METMRLTEFLSDAGRPIAFYPKLRVLTGSTTATILLCQFIYWRGKESDPDGWLYKTAEEIEDETGLSYKEQKVARKHLKEAGFLEEHYARLDHNMRFRIDMSAIDERWRMYQGDVPESTNGTMANDPLVSSLNESETTTENTTKTDWSSLKKDAQERKAKQRAAKKDMVDAFKEVQPALKAQQEMRQRVENALRRNLDWDSARSPWNGYDKKLVAREKETGQTIEGFMKWLNADEFRKKQTIYLTPTKIEDWWITAFAQEPTKERRHKL